MTLNHEYHSPDNTPALYVAPWTNAANALQLTGVPLTDANALHVAIVDGSGDQITSFGGGTQYADGAARGTATGTIAMIDDGTNIQSLSGDSTGKLNVNNISGTITLPTLAATSTKQSDGTQKTQIVDGSGNVIGATSNALDINIKSGNLTTLPVTNAGTFAVQEATLDAALIAQEAATSSIKGITIFGAVTTAAPSYTTAKSDALSLTTAGALRTDIATIAGTAPTTVGKLDIKGADGDVFIRQTTASNLNATVVGTGTFAVQATPVTQADTFMLGGVNVKEINGVTPLMGNGITGTGSQRVTIASDNTAFAVNATLSAETTKVIGVTRTADGGGNLLTSNSTTYTAKFGLDSNLLGTLGTAFSTAGKVDVKAADGDVFVRSNAASTFPTQATLQTQTDTVMVGGVNIKEINAVTPLMGNGITGTGSQRVTVASDNTPFPIKIDQTTPGTTNAVALAQLGSTTVSVGVGASGAGTQRQVIANDAGKTLVSKGGSVASSGDNTLVVAGTNRLKVYAFSLSTISTTAVTCIFQSGASGTELWRVVLQTPASVAGGANLVVQPPAWLFATAAATLLNMNLSAAVTVHYSVSYFDEA